jgi:hypothetical protein
MGRDSHPTAPRRSGADVLIEEIKAAFSRQFGY